MRHRRQPGIETPSAADQLSLLVVQLKLTPQARDFRTHVNQGLKGFIRLFSEHGNGLSGSLFTATLGFGQGFYQALNVTGPRRPRLLRDMPAPPQTVKPAFMGYPVEQSDIIIVLASSALTTAEASILRAKNDGTQLRLAPDRQTLRRVLRGIVETLPGWAQLHDVHDGFRRGNHRNLLGFIDGISNPEPGSDVFRDLVWTTADDESAVLADGTYLAFQKIAHDLDRWQDLGPSDQEKWVGRSKGTGLLLGTLSPDQDKALAEDLVSGDPATRQAAMERWRALVKEQRDPTRQYYHVQAHDDKIPVWSHIRKANPRAEGGHSWPHVIYRRGANYVEGQNEAGGFLIEPEIIPSQDPYRNGGVWPCPLPRPKIARSGLLFLGFQRNLQDSLDYMQTQWLQSKTFPDKSKRTDRQREHLKADYLKLKVVEVKQAEMQDLLKVLEPALSQTVQHGGAVGAKDEWTVEEVLKLGPINGKDQRAEFNKFIDALDPGPEAFHNPTRLGLNPKGEDRITFTLGGGYYYIPPLRLGDATHIDELFF